MFHNVVLSQSKRYLLPSHQTPPIIRAPGLTNPVPQALIGPNLERVGLSGMGEIASNQPLDVLTNPRTLPYYQTHASLYMRHVCQLKLMGSMIFRSSIKETDPLVLSSPSWIREPPTPTQRPDKSPTWSNWASTSASIPKNTPSAQSTTEQSSSGP